MLASGAIMAAAPAVASAIEAASASFLNVIASRLTSRSARRSLVSRRAAPTPQPTRSRPAPTPSATTVPVGGSSAVTIPWPNTNDVTNIATTTNPVRHGTGTRRTSEPSSAPARLGSTSVTSVVVTSRAESTTGPSVTSSSRGVSTGATR